jgi:hypothetical protein
VTRNTAAVCASLLIGIRLAFAQSSPSGPEFRVNTVTTFSQYSPSVSVNPSTGAFLVVWHEGLDCLAQPYDSSGTQLGGSFTALTSELPCSGAVFPGVGNFVVFGTQGTADGDFVSCRVFDVNGVGGYLMPANTFVAHPQSGIRVAQSPSGAYVVVWGTSGEDGDGYGVFARRYAFYTPVGSELQVNTTTTGDQKAPSVAMGGSGGFVVVWQSGPLNAARCCTQIEAQRYDASGNALGGEFRVNTYSGLDNFSPDVGTDDVGNFVIVWTSYPYGYAAEVNAQRFSMNGAALGDPFVVNGNTGIGASHPRVTRRSGDFVVVWQEPSDGSGLAVVGRRYAPDGSALGETFRVNTFTTGDQSLPAISSKPNGGFVVAWESNGQDGSGEGIYAQKYCLGGDADGSGTVDVSDVFYLINFLFAGGPAPLGCSDVNGDDHVDISDVFYLINYLFASGPAPQ